MTGYSKVLVVRRRKRGADARHGNSLSLREKSLPRIVEDQARLNWMVQAAPALGRIIISWIARFSFHDTGRETVSCRVPCERALHHGNIIND